jgi:hypothetical protein
MNQLVFTRYLYPKSDVKQSLLISLLERDSNQALFWAYELYFSGFEKDIFDLIENTYDSFYKLENPELEDFIKEKRGEWTRNDSRINSRNDCIIGSIILTLCLRKYQICDFIKNYIGEPCFPNIYSNTKMMKFLVNFKDTDLEQYKTKIPEKEKLRHYLSKACKYPIRREYNDFFKMPCLDLKKEFYYLWEYYASKSPIWMSRIQEYHGIINDETLELLFPSEELFNSFYEQWGIEPDEQSNELTEKCIGDWSKKQLSIEDFCERFGGLKNTIVYANA